MAKAVKKEVPVAEPIKKDLILLLNKMKGFVEGPGTVADRQDLVKELEGIIEKI
jgi:hypothetical protein